MIDEFDLSSVQAAELLHVSVRHIRKLGELKKVLTKRCGRFWYFSRQDVLTYRNHVPDNRWMTREERFWTKVDKTGDCWIWTAASLGGYGQFGTEHGTSGAHRFSYGLANGPIPSGLNVCHSCDTPLCVKPDHLFVGTQQENVIDSYDKGRHKMSQRGKEGISTANKQRWADPGARQRMSVVMTDIWKARRDTPGD